MRITPAGVGNGRGCPNIQLMRKIEKPGFSDFVGDEQELVDRQHESGQMIPVKRSADLGDCITAANSVWREVTREMDMRAIKNEG